MGGVVGQTATVLDACRLSHLPNQVAIYLAKGSDIETVHINPPSQIVTKASVDGAWVITVDHLQDHPISLVIHGEHITLDVAADETDLFAGRNAVLAVRNGESPEQAAEWITYHHTHHSMQAAVILDRANSLDSDAFAAALQGLIASEMDVMIAVLSSPAPLGMPNLPSEQHPFCAPNAPGKDRMTVPKPDPFRSPLQEVHVFEICRHRFLAKARAVANIELYDLLLLDGARSVFDQAVDAPNGAIPLAGQMCYPWRLRVGKDPRFADHTCVQFDETARKRRWCIAPGRLPDEVTWKFIRVIGVSGDIGPIGHFVRCMSIRHPTARVSRIVPKTSLIENEFLLALSQDKFGGNPVRMPEAKKEKVIAKGSVAIVTTMKNEGPFILEWLAYHRVIGVDRFLVYTNDCTDGTDMFLDLLQDKGYLQHRDNPFKGTDLKPQHAALQAAESEDIMTTADWVVCMDVDEYINVKVGDGTLSALFNAVPKANMISMTWRLFGNDDVHEFHDSPIIGQFSSCAEEMCRKPHQAWGFKTLYRNVGLFNKMGVHRPKGLKSQLWEDIHWVNGSGAELPKTMFRNAWRSTSETVGYDLVQLNHYAVRSAESFLVKRDRGRVNHVDRDQGLAYWFRMNHNAEKETTIQRMLPKLRAEMDRLLADPDIAAQHTACVQAHRQKIDELKATENYANFYAELTGDRMQRLSKMLRHFGANVFLAGPECVPDEVVFQDHPDTFFFTTEKVGTKH
jgi:hypothetical protein